MPFTSLRLKAPRPHCLPRGYPTELRTLGDHIRKRRLDLGLWQRTVAKQLGVRSETLRLWEHGLARPLARHYSRIVRFLGYDPEPGDRSLAGRLRATRRRLGLSQADFAASVGLDEGSVCRWESGSRTPSRWMAGRVAAILDRLESQGHKSGADAMSEDGYALSYFDRTRWRRRPPPDLTSGQAVSLGDRLRQRRLELGLSQAQLGRRFGVGRVTVYRWERGVAPPPERRRSAVTAFFRRGKGKPRRPK